MNRTPPSSIGNSKEDARNAILEYITLLNITPGTILPSERAFAEKFKIGRWAVSQAVNALIENGTLKRTGRKLSLLSLHKNCEQLPVYAIIRDFKEDKRRFAIFQEELSKYGIQTEAKVAKFGTMDPHWVEEALSTNIAGLAILTGERFFQYAADLPRKILESNTPIVCNASNPYFSSVIIDKRIGWEKQIAHLVKQGYQFFNFLETESEILHRGSESSIFQDTCQKHGINEANVTVAFTENSNSSSIIKYLDQLVSPIHPKTVFCCTSNRLAEILYLTLGKRKITCPKDCGITAGTWASKNDVRTNNRTSCYISYEWKNRLLACILATLIQQKSNASLEPERQCIRIEPTLNPGDSTRKFIEIVEESTSKSDINEKDIFFFGQFWTASDKEKQKQINRSWEDKYSVAKQLKVDKTNKEHLIPTIVDISSHANRAHYQTKGWLNVGPPPTFFTSGMKNIHGIPFKVIDGNSNHDNSYLVMRSSKHLTSENKPLPSSLTIPINQRAKHIFFLLSCAYVHSAEKLGHFCFTTSSNKTHSLALKPLGRYSEFGHNDFLKRYAYSNIQDCWHNVPQISNENSRFLIVNSSSEKWRLPYFFYTLKWTNPSPDESITSIVINSNEKRDGTFGIFSITTLS